MGSQWGNSAALVYADRDQHGMYVLWYFVWRILSISEQARYIAFRQETKKLVIGSTAPNTLWFLYFYGTARYQSITISALQQ